MHAMIVTVKIEPSRIAEAQQFLAAEVVPMVKQIPGVLSAYWLDPVEGRGFSLALFDTEANARAAVANIPNVPMPDFVKPDTVEVREVIANI